MGLMTFKFMVQIASIKQSQDSNLSVSIASSLARIDFLENEFRLAWLHTAFITAVASEFRTRDSNHVEF